MSDVSDDRLAERLRLAVVYETPTGYPLTVDLLNEAADALDEAAAEVERLTAALHAYEPCSLVGGALCRYAEVERLRADLFTMTVNRDKWLLAQEQEADRRRAAEARLDAVRALVAGWNERHDLPSLRLDRICAALGDEGGTPAALRSVADRMSDEDHPEFRDLLRGMADTLGDEGATPAPSACVNCGHVGTYHDDGPCSMGMGGGEVCCCINYFARAWDNAISTPDPGATP